MVQGERPARMLTSALSSSHHYIRVLYLTHAYTTWFKARNQTLTRQNAIYPHAQNESALFLPMVPEGRAGNSSSNSSVGRSAA